MFTTTTCNTPLFTIGDIVLIDNQDKAYIISIRGEINDLFFILKFVIGQTIEQNVSQYRCRVVPIFEHQTSSRNTNPTRRHFLKLENTPLQQLHTINCLFGALLSNCYKIQY